MTGIHHTTLQQNFLTFDTMYISSLIPRIEANPIFTQSPSFSLFATFHHTTRQRHVNVVHAAIPRRRGKLGLDHVHSHHG